jgi:hypothetical protein
MTRFLLPSDSCGFVDVGALSLTIGRVCRLNLLLGLASAVILGSESRGTRDHILLSQIRDFSFRRLLLLAGLRWRYSVPPPHGRSAFLSLHAEYLIWYGPHRKQRVCVQQFFYCWHVFVAVGTCLVSHCLATIITSGSTSPDF